jgi:flavodoxin
MIFYFTGTGNSLWVAKMLSEYFHEALISIATELNEKKEGNLLYSLRADEKIFFVYPIHSWGPAVSVMRFISRLQLKNYDYQPIYSVATCGDECGYANRLLEKVLNKQQLVLTAAYSVTMPNNYILLPGFNVDNKKVEKKKLEQAPQRVTEIIEAIQIKDKDKLTSLFSQESLNYAQSFDESINELFDYFDGEVVSYDDGGGPYVETTKDYNQILQIMESSYDVKTTECEYRIAIKNIVQNSTNAHSVGVQSLYIIKSEDDVNRQYAYWGDGAFTPGINIGIPNN